MPVWRYMELCLTHPEHGYYVSRDPLGREGDFTTSPEISQMFGELLGLWSASVWRSMGSPSELRLVELGPGRGTMMADALRAMRVVPPLYETLSVHLVEINPLLRERQRATLSNASNIAWHDSIDDVPQGPAIILANEYFDVLPIHQAVKGKTGWHERVIKLAVNDELMFGQSAEPIPRFEVLLPPTVRAAPVGAVFEWRPDGEIMKIASRVREQDGAALIIDYGHPEGAGMGRRDRACRLPGAWARRHGCRRPHPWPGHTGRVLAAARDRDPRGNVDGQGQP
jgi:NADH dehydrogenase [ubiquinone] 1 alpha subcomplex assembly factor 7